MSIQKASIKEHWTSHARLAMRDDDGQHAAEYVYSGLIVKHCTTFIAHTWQVHALFPIRHQSVNLLIAPFDLIHLSENGLGNNLERACNSHRFGGLVSPILMAIVQRGCTAGCLLQCNSKQALRCMNPANSARVRQLRLRPHPTPYGLNCSTK